MFSRTAEYAVRAVLVLAWHDGAEPLSADDLAAALGAPRNYLGKTLHTLVRHGILRSARGPHGGFTLAISPNRLSVADIVKPFAEQKVALDKCIMANRLCNPDDPCAAHERWSDITRRAREPLMRTMISELFFCQKKFVPDVPVADHTGAIIAEVGRNPILIGPNS